STEAWSPMIKRKRHQLPIEWSPVPSNVMTEIEPRSVAAARANYVSRADQLVVGHFGTFGNHIAPMLDAILPLILAGGSERIGLLLGGGSDRYLAQFLQYHPELAGKVFASGSLPSVELATHLAVCDVLVQPYVDGV